MRNYLSIILLIIIFNNTLLAQNTNKTESFSIVTCPAEITSNQMNISWATDTTTKEAIIEYTILKDNKWTKSKKQNFKGKLCTTYDSVFSKTKDNKDFYENVVITKYNATLIDLKKSTEYKYRIITKDTSNTHYFKTSGNKEWSACIISDFHVYSPAYSRTKAAMDMVNTIAKYNQPFQWVLHLGDITAWGGSYSFWRDMYKEENFHKYMWAGVNGNHDNMTRGYIRTTNEFFRDANAYPKNGYKTEEGVSYYFKYGEALFIMLNNEAIKTDDELKQAQEWVTKVVENNPSKYKIVCEHYQWFYGETGKDSQYARWNNLFDKLGITLALGANNHIYATTHPIYNGKATKNKGTVYIQTPSSDNERGVECNTKEELKYNPDKIRFRWTEGAKTIGGMHMKVNKKRMILTLLDRNGNIIDTTIIYNGK